MTAEKKTQDDHDLSPEESDKLDDDLLAMDILYRTRCVAPTPGNNVTVTEVEEKEQ